MHLHPHLLLIHAAAPRIDYGLLLLAVIGVPQACDWLLLPMAAGTAHDDACNNNVLHAVCDRVVAHRDTALLYMQLAVDCPQMLQQHASAAAFCP